MRGMKRELPELDYEKLVPTRDYLQNAAKILGKWQQVFLPENPHDWQRGLEAGPAGLQTQDCRVNSRPLRGQLDLAKHAFRIGDSSWRFADYDAPELLNNVKVWLEGRGLGGRLTEPEFTPGQHTYDKRQGEAYAAALSWLHAQFETLRASLKPGLVSPVLLYPHHFDLSLSWFPYDDERQLTLGWSTGDETIHEPYLYLTAYPEPAGFTKLTLPAPAYWQHDGFSGAVLTHNNLAAGPDPAAMLRQFTEIMKPAKDLLAIKS